MKKFSVFIGWIGIGILSVLSFIILANFFSSKNNSNVLKTQVAHANTSRVISSTPPTLSASQKSQVVSILEANFNQFIQLWQTGQESLESVQYTDPYQEMAALSTPTSAAAKFNAFKNEFNSGSSYVAAMNAADKIYPTGVSNVPVRVWSSDMGHVVVDMQKWITDAQSWQLAELSQNALNSDANVVVKDFANVQNDIKAIGE